MMFIVGCSKIKLEMKCYTQQHVFLRRQWPTRYATVLGVSRSRSRPTILLTLPLLIALDVSAVNHRRMSETLHQSGRDLEFNI